MLMLGLHEEHCIRIGAEGDPSAVIVCICRIRGERVKLGVIAPEAVKVNRIGTLQEYHKSQAPSPKTVSAT